MNGDRERCLAAGMDGYVSKPLEPQALFSMVEEGTSGGAAASALAAVSFDEASALARFGGDRELLADVIKIFLEDCPERLRAIEAAVTARDSERVRFEAHGLKGAAGNLSASGVFEAAAMLERLAAEARVETIEAAWRRLAAEAAQLVDSLTAFHATVGATH
jgi:HPt (histidine-containing phosphotransfer) domain-containing protein